MNSLLVLFLCSLGVTTACWSSNSYEKGCCTVTIVNNYCKSSDGKASISTNIKGGKPKTKWGDVIIPAPSRPRRSTEDCIPCQIDTAECLELYNDYAMELGFDLLTFEQVSETGEVEVGYK